MVNNKFVNSLYQIIRRRSSPGILIFDQKNRVLYMNREAHEILPYPEGARKRNRIMIPGKIRNLLNRLKENKDSKEVGAEIFEDHLKRIYSARAFFIGDHENPSSPIMVLLEKIVEKRTIDFEKVKQEFSLSKREIEVLRLISEGFNNREISEKLFISEYTVKDHIKKIMRKTGLKSRGAIIASLK